MTCSRRSTFRTCSSARTTSSRRTSWRRSPTLRCARMSDPATVIPELRTALREVDPDMAVLDIRTMQDLVDTSLGSQTLAVRLLWIFAGSALLISIAGIYGLLAYNVSQRTRDIGLRMALGATRGNVIQMILGQAVLLLAIGVGIGIVAAISAGSVLRSFLYGVVPYDAMTIRGCLRVAAGLRTAGQLHPGAPGVAHRPDQGAAVGVEGQSRHLGLRRRDGEDSPGCWVDSASAPGQDANLEAWYATLKARSTRIHDHSQECRTQLQNRSGADLGLAPRRPHHPRGRVHHHHGPVRRGQIVAAERAGAARRPVGGRILGSASSRCT